MRIELESATAAQTAYRSGKPDDAIAAANRVIAGNPFAAEAHLVKALLAIRRNQIPETIESLKHCVAVRPGEWIVERIRQDFQAHGMPPLQKDMAFRLGAFFRSHLSALGPPVPVAHRRACGEFINIVGSSYVRSFGGDPAFFPLFIGMGPTMLLLNDEQEVVTRRKFFENLKRVDLSRDTMLIAGSDPYYYVVQLQKDGGLRPDGATAEDYAQMDAVAERHRGILADAKAMVAGRSMLLGLTPTFNDHMNQLCRHLNVRLKAICEEAGVLFLDWWDELVDPVTGHLRVDYGANAYPGDIHFSLACTKRFMELLKEGGLLSEAITPGADYQWSHVFETMVEATEKTRIWCEPSVTPRNAFQSNKVAASHLGNLMADLLISLSVRAHDQSYLMVNVREAFLPVAMPPQIVAGCLAFTDTPANVQVGQQVLDFYGRLDVHLKSSDEFAVLNGHSFAKLVLLIHPDTVEADEQRCNAVLGRLGASTSVIVGTPRPDRIGLLNLGGRQPKILNISNRHIPEQWRDYSIGLVGV
ncbi:M48 family metallopeptidase [Phenylobacterium sp. Root700]|uniref:tetratricopeptide repeat protein n=1 Tax=Phenylobacterium sp. Root700 TaxID=1736591 RepID=UPI000A6A2117|nr:tetratricopeptide repeat protein [Phenylobacterium sp. Root700]